MLLSRLCNNPGVLETEMKLYEYYGFICIFAISRYILIFYSRKWFSVKIALHEFFLLKIDDDSSLFIPGVSQIKCTF